METTSPNETNLAVAPASETGPRSLGGGGVSSCRCGKPKTRLYAAILAAQKNMATVRKNGENPHFRNRYATLDEIWETNRRAINDAGLVVYATIEREEKDWLLVTHLVHAESGEETTSVFPILVSGTPQGIGSWMTYARRYTLSALLQVITGDGEDEDDDGEAAEADAPRKSSGPNATAIANALGF